MKILRRTLPILSAVLLLVSCNKDAGQIEKIDGPASDAEKKEVTFFFSTAEMDSPVSTALANTATTRAVNETDLKNVRVLQFDGKGANAKLIFNKFYGSEDIVTDKDDANKKILYVTLFEKEETCIYIIANNKTKQFQWLDDTKDEELGNALTLGSFKSMTLDFENEGDVTLTDTALPMTGSFEGEISASASITIKLTRLVSKVTFTCNVDIPTGVGESFDIKRVQLVNVASKVGFDAIAVPTAQTGLFPDGSSSDNFMDYAEEAVSGAPLQCTWYLPENLRGVVTGLTEKTKDLEHAPAHSTCIDVSGEYTKNGTLTDVTYRIYLGKNNSTDFNLIRNNSYNVTATILGINQSDKRVIVEKGIPAGKYDDGEWK